MPLKSIDSAKEKQAMQSLGEDMLDRITAEFSLQLAALMPVESGHAHEAFFTAMEKLPLERTQAVPRTSGAMRSGDPEAIKRGIAGYGSTPDKVWASLQAALPFLDKLERGVTIRVGDLSGNKGAKENHSSLGELYGPRKPGTSGFLVWRDSEGMHMEKTRKISPGMRFMRKAVQKARLLAKQLGLKRKK